MAKFLDRLAQITYCRLGVSDLPKAGVGVIAVRDIPKGVNPFAYARNRCNLHHEETIRVHRDDLAETPLYLRKLVIDFVYPDQDGYYDIPADGLNCLDISFYLNNSQDPNLDVVDGGCNLLEFRTNRRIRKGEELLIDYDDYKY